MSDLVRVKYLKELNQLGLIGSSVLEKWIKGDVPSPGIIQNIILRYVKRINSSSENGVILGSCYTNLNRYYAKVQGCNLLVFPLFGEEVFYEIGEDVDCLVGRNDPKIVCPLKGINFCIGDAVLLFSKNPFIKNNYDRDLKEDVFQCRLDIESFYSRHRRKLLQKASILGMGSLEAFV